MTVEALARSSVKKGHANSTTQWACATSRCSPIESKASCQCSMRFPSLFVAVVIFFQMKSSRKFSRDYRLTLHIFIIPAAARAVRPHQQCGPHARVRACAYLALCALDSMFIYVINRTRPRARPRLALMQQAHNTIHARHSGIKD